MPKMESGVVVLASDILGEFRNSGSTLLFVDIESIVSRVRANIFVISHGGV